MPFRLASGILPPGVNISYSARSGVAPQAVDVDLASTPETQTGSFSLMIVYMEDQPSGATLKNFCQLNLIIE